MILCGPILQPAYHEEFNLLRAGLSPCKCPLLDASDSSDRRTTAIVKVFGCRPSQVVRLGMGPAYGNRPSTNPRGTGATLWGFEDFGVAVWVAR